MYLMKTQALLDWQVTSLKAVVINQVITMWLQRNEEQVFNFTHNFLHLIFVIIIDGEVLKT